MPRPSLRRTRPENPPGQPDAGGVPLTAGAKGRRVGMLAALALAAVLFAALIARVEIQSNDDTYIYFNYARNAALGHVFAYDNRGIRSEGFTSPLYLALLVPFEINGTPMMYAAAVANLAALALTVLASAGLLRDAGALDPWELAPFGVAFLSLAVLDEHVATVIGRGLETLLGPLFVILALWGAVRWLDPDRSESERSSASVVFLLAAFGAFLIRPENLVPLGACGTALLVLGRSENARRSLLRQTAVFVAVLAVYHGAKAVVFGDVFATAWYRKVRFDGAGVEHAAAALGAYAGEIAVVISLAAAAITVERANDRRGAWPRPLVLLVVAAVGSVLAVLPTHPLITYAFRYFVNASILLHLGVAFTAIRLVRACVADVTGWSATVARNAVAGILAVTAAASAFGSGGVESIDTATKRLNLRARAVADAEAHHYLSLGRFLRERLTAHEDITLAFGDAGALAYAFRSRFVDLNGLTEPAIAHLFRLPDGPEKTRRFIAHVNARAPDIVILGFAERNADGSYTPFENEHSPFRGPTPLDVFRAYRDAGIAFVCSIHAYYDLHIGVASGSPHAAEIGAALLEYCRAHGSAIGERFVVTDGRESVVFPPIASLPTQENVPRR